MKNYLSLFNDNVYVKTINTFLTFSPTIGWALVQIKLNRINTMNLNFDWIGLLTALITSFFLFMLFYMFRQLLKLYKHSQIKYIVLRIIEDMRYANLDNFIRTQIYLYTTQQTWRDELEKRLRGKFPKMTVEEIKKLAIESLQI
jgi:hypothetical protein